MSRCRCCQHTLDSSINIPSPTQSSLAQTFEKLRKSVAELQLVVDLKIWKRSQWLEKGGVFSLLVRAYNLVDSVETREKTYALSELYHEGFSKEILENSSRKFFKLLEIEQVLFLINDVYLPHLQYDKDICSFVRASNYFAEQCIMIGSRLQQTRFKQLCYNIQQNIKDYDGEQLSSEQIVEFSEKIWKKIYDNFKKELRKERIFELIRQIQKSLKYEQKKLEAIKELGNLNYVDVTSHEDEVFAGYIGKMLKQLLAKPRIKDQVLALFDKYNNKFLLERKG